MPSAFETVLGEIEARDAAARASLLQKTNPDVAGKANALARRQNLPPDVVERNLPEVENQDRLARNKRILDRYPVISSWSLNARNAAVAIDDYETLGKVVKVFDQVKSFGARALYRTTGGLYGAIEGAAEGLQAVEQVAMPGGLDAQRRLFGDTVFNYVASFARDRRKEAETMIAENPNRVTNFIGKNLIAGAESVPAILATALATRSPTAVASISAVPVAGSEYGRAREAGKGVAQSAIYGTSQGLIEFATEKIPASALVGDIVAKSPFVKTFLGQLTREIPSEQVATFFQDLNEWATLNPEKPVVEFLKDRPLAAAETLVATIGGVGSTSIATKAAEYTVRAGDKMAGRLIRADSAAADAALVEKIGALAAASKTQTRDPEAFASLIETLSAGTPAENVYIPADKVRAYLQSDDFSDNEFWSEYRDEIEDAAISGGDLVIPLSKAAAYLPNTPAWEALRGDIRLSPGGESLNEANAFNDAIGDEFQRAADQVAADAEIERKRAEPRAKLFDSAQQKLLAAGERPDVAKQQAELIAARYATRAERLGRELTGNEFDAVDVRQVLPESLAAIQTPDTLGVIANIMRKGAVAVPTRSLVEFVRSRGGIDDRGGDLAAMGFAPIKGVGSKGARKIIRKTRDEIVGGQESIFGPTGNDNSADTLAQYAWDAGFFPDFNERPTANDLLEALGNDLQIPVNTGPTEQMQRSADDLRNLLIDQGLDPVTATDAEIRAAVNAYQGQAEGRGYEQLGDTIDVDGQSRPTKNSKGQQIAGTADGVRNFWRWFGDSKVVDDQGRPLVVYHGTDKSFAKVNFKKGAQGLFWFASDRAQIESGTVGAARSGVIMELYAKIEQPADWKKYDKLGLYEFKREGLDGAILNDPDGTFTGFVLNDPTQIKSVNNVGSFDPSDPRILYQSAYHGSPHIFDKFSLDKIGTGEGAQSYGWGLYFAGNKDIAAHYRNILSQKSLIESIENSIADSIGYIDEAYASEVVSEAIQSGSLRKDELNFLNALKEDDFLGFDYLHQAIKSAIKFPERFDISPELEAATKALGRLYKVQIPDDGEYLLWDKPLSEQPEKVKAAIKRITQPRRDALDSVPEIDGTQSFEEFNRQYGDALETAANLNLQEGDTGERIYRALRSLAGMTQFRKQLREQGSNLADARNDQQFASMLLHDAGIAGIKYLDGGSRKAGDGTYNYVVFDDNRVSIQAYEQEGARGRAVFGNEQVIIELFQNRNLSTVIHELGHVWLEELKVDASLPDAPDSLKADWQTVVDWFKANGHDVTDGVIPVEAHELWARGIERYTMEGKSPSSALRKAFNAFKSWMLSIYQVVNNMRSPITPEVREVMDRLIATDAEINQARDDQNVMVAFDSLAAAQDFGMSETAYNDYVRLASDARDESFDALLFKTMAAIRRRVTQEYKDARASIVDDVRARIDATPVFRALELIKQGNRLDKAAVVEMFGLDVLNQLPAGVPPVVVDGGADPDIVAEMAGFPTGDDMIRAMIGVETRRLELRALGDKRTVRQHLIDQEADAILVERFGDPLNDGSIEDEALAAVHSDKQGEVISAELRALSRKSGKTPTPYRIARQWASERVLRGIVNDVVSRAAIQRYARAASKAGEAAQEAIAARNSDEAFRQKQIQMLNNALVAEAKAAADNIDNAVKRMAKYAKRRTIKTMDQDYLERIHDLLERVDLKQRSQASEDRKGSFAEWAETQKELGHDVVVPNEFAETLGQTNWSRLTVEQILGLDAAVKQIAHMGRFKQKLIDAKEERDFDAVVNEALGELRNLPPVPPSNLMEPGFVDRVKSGIASIDASLLKMEAIIDWLDGGNPNGVFNRIVFKPIADAQDSAAVRTEEFGRKLTEIMADVPKDIIKKWSRRVTVPELMNAKTGEPWVFNRASIVSMALNMGNEGNIQRLVDGYGWNENAVRDVLNRELTKPEWDFVQSVWDTVNSLWPDLAAMERRVNGVEPEKIEPVPIETPFGTYRGGYFPAVYDSAKDSEVREIETDKMFGAAYTRASSRSSATKARAEKVSRPILLQLGVINRHMREVIHDITHREAIMQANKFMSSRRVNEAVRDVLGNEIADQFQPWLKYVANQWAHERAGNEGFGKFLSMARANTTFVGMGFRASTILMQVAGLANSAEAIGTKWVVNGAVAVSRNPRAAFKFALDRSGELRARVDGLDRDIRSQLLRLEGKNAVIDDARRFAFKGIGWMDRLVSVPTWLGAYNKGISEGMDEEQAIYAADKAIRVSQGSGAAKDLASVQRGTGRYGEAMKMLTMFYTYMSAYYQRQRTLARDIRGQDKRRKRDISSLLARAFFLIPVAAILPELIVGRGPDDEEDWGMWAFQRMIFSALGPIPVLRDVAPVAAARIADKPTFGYKFTPAQGLQQSFINISGDVGNFFEGEETTRATRNVLEFAGYATGLVPGQFASAAQFFVDVSYDEYDPQTMGDWVEGITTGKIKEDE